MKTNLFEGQNLSPKEILDNLESENWGMEDNHSFTKPFTDDELQEVQDEYLEKSKELHKLNKKIDELVKPLKDEANSLKKETKHLMVSITSGGKKVNERVFLYPIYETNSMGMYDSRGILVDQRPMTMAERKAGRQMYINSNPDSQIANG